MDSTTRITVSRWEPDGPREVIGHVTTGCDNLALCRLADTAGLPYHATPMGFGCTLSAYHYRTIDEAVQALELAMDGIPGRNPELSVEEDIEWRNGCYAA